MLTFGFLNENSEFLRLYIEEMLAEYKTFWDQSYNNENTLSLLKELNE